MPSARVRFSTARLMVAVAIIAFCLAITPPDARQGGLFMSVAGGLAAFQSRRLAVVAGVFLAYLALVEVVAFELVPAFLYAPTAFLISGPLWPEGPNRWRSVRLRWLIAVNALVLSLYLVPWSTRKPFLRHFDSIRPGMTVAEVDRVMAGYWRYASLTSPGPGQGAGPSGHITFRHSNHALLNMDLGGVTFQDGRVVDVDFLPD